MKRFLLLFGWMLALSAMAQVCSVNELITIDGKLNEASWKKAPRQGNFHVLGRDDAKVAEETVFSILHDKANIYVGVICHESKIAEMKNSDPGSVWNSDAVEMFISPAGRATEYYQFLMSARGFRYNMFYAEGGNIRPDPYGPDWEFKIHFGADFYSIEVRIPLTAFYMTPRSAWQTTWLLNMTRQNRLHNQELSTWSKLEKKFLEPQNFRKFSGFPIIPEEDDLHIRSAFAKIKSKKDGRFIGELQFQTQSARFDRFLFRSPVSRDAEVSMRAGSGQVTVPCAFEKEGRIVLPLTLIRLKDRKVFRRTYPVQVVYNPLDIRLTAPEYRNNFYPGQDSTRITGQIFCEHPEQVRLELTGAGPVKLTAVPAEDGSFTISTPAFPFGKAVLKAVYGKLSKEVAIRKLPAVKRQMSWISKGCLIVNGKPVFRRNMYAQYYCGGEAFRKKYDADNLHITREIREQAGWLEPVRLIRDIESREATLDVRPCKELFDKIDQVIENNRNRDFTYYYLSDEPECRNLSPVYLEHIYRHIAEKDPYHVVLMCCRSGRKYINCMDWCESHPYINPYYDKKGVRRYDRDISTLGSYLDSVGDLNRPDKCIGFCPTIFCGRSYSSNEVYPTFREIVCHSWAGLVRGARSFYPYAYHDLGDRPALYEGTRYIFSTADALQNLLLLGTRKTLIRNQTCEAAFFKQGKDSMLVIVNFTDKAQKITLPGKLKGRYLEFRGSRSFSGRKFSLKSQEVIVATSRKMDQGLPGYQEVSALIDRQEAARLARKNLLTGKEREVIISSSSSCGLPYEMFDGTLDVQAWYDYWAENKFFEISFPEFIPEFTCLRIYGRNIQDTKVTMRKRGEWQELVPSSKKTGEYMVEFKYPEKKRTVKLRMEFSHKYVELYEIELVK